MQHSIENSLRGIEDRLGGLEDRMGNIEDRQREVQSLNSTPGSSFDSPSCDSEKGRKRRSPPELQVWLTYIMSIDM